MKKKSFKMLTPPPIFLSLFITHTLNMLYFLPLSRFMLMPFAAAELGTHTHTHTNTYCVVGNAINWTIIWSIIWRSIERPSSGNDWCGCDNECLRCYDEFFRAFCGPVAKRIFISQSGHCRFIAMLTGAGPDIAGQEYGAHIGHIQCY